MADTEPYRLLVICTGNRARSQMAHGWLQSIGGERVSVFSAGTEPKTVHPIAVRVMAEVGIDISGHTSDHINQYLNDDFDLVLTVCDTARSACPPATSPPRSPLCSNATGSAWHVSPAAHAAACWPAPVPAVP